MARCGILTASEMKHVVSRKTDKKTGLVTYKSPTDDKSVAHLYELAAQRVNQYVEPSYIGDDMLRGQDDESHAREAYDENYEAITECGFVTNDEWGFTIGYSPDWLVGSDGQGEAKSRRQKYQLETIATKKVPEEYVIQNQTGLLVTRRKWCDYTSYCGGMPMITLRVDPDKEVQDAIIEAATSFHEKLKKLIKEYSEVLADPAMRLIPTERREIAIGTYE